MKTKTTTEFLPGDVVARGPRGNDGMVVPHHKSDCDRCRDGQVPVIFRSVLIHVDAADLDLRDRPTYKRPFKFGAMEAVAREPAG